MEYLEKEIEESIEKILKKIKDTRKLKGLSHENMAVELNISPSAYNKLERRETTLSLERLLKIKQILDLCLPPRFKRAVYW
jgi:ribosome-binding protein aMBF1 (putative translation factor)